MDTCKILVVDDQPLVNMMLREALTKSKFIAFGAHSSREAVKIVKNDQPDIALLDVNLPDIDGISLLQKLKKYKSDIRAVFISGHIDPHFAERAKKEGALGFFPKPFDIFELMAFLRKIATSDVGSRGEVKWDMDGGKA